MAKLFQVIVPDENQTSRIINSGNQVHELMVIEREDKKFVSDHNKDLEKPALYILINSDAKKLYVGETDDSIKRLRNHGAKDFWTEAIVFHSTTETLSTTEVKWLEAKAYKTLADLGYYDLSENKQKPQFPKLKKYQELDLEPIFEEAKGYICAAGFDIFQKQKGNKKDEEEKKKGNLIPCFYNRNADAKGLLNPETEELIVLEGSKINPNDLPNLQPEQRAKRKKKMAEYTVRKGDDVIVTSDISFKSPSGAAKFCCGGAANGWLDWKDEKGNSIEIHRKK